MNLDRLRDLLACEDPAWVLQGVELLRTQPPSVWVPVIAELETILARATRVEIARSMAKWSRWDLAAAVGGDIWRVVTWECGASVSDADAAFLCCVFARSRFKQSYLLKNLRGLRIQRYLPGWFQQPPQGRVNIAYDLPGHQLTLACDVPFCNASAVVEGCSEAECEEAARDLYWRLDPDRWCYCPDHHDHPPVGGPALGVLPAQTLLPF